MNFTDHRALKSREVEGRRNYTMFRKELIFRIVLFSYELQTQVQNCGQNTAMAVRETRRKGETQLR